MNYNNSSAKLLAVALLVLVQWVSVSVSEWGCKEEERSALLQINAALPFPIHSSHGNWELGNKECCRWERITCDQTTGHVTQLDLATDDWSYDSQGFSLNVTLFLPLRQLRSLSLSGQALSDCAGLETWSKLTKLESLDLSNNRLDGSIISKLANVRSLRTLKLTYNNINNSMAINGLKTWSNLTKLEVLDISANQLDGSIIYDLASIPSLRTLQLSDNIIYNNMAINGFESWSNLTKLETLDLSGNQLPKSIISSIAKVSSLRELYLNYNSMGGNVPVKELSALNLEVVSLSNCMFSESIPYLGHWSSLKALSLAANDLSGILTSKGLEAQFSAFGISSFEGNPNLCGPPLSKSCVPTLDTTQPSPNEMSDDRRHEDTNFLILFGSFSLSFVVSFWGFIVVLYIKRNWCYVLFTLVDWYGDMIYVNVVLLTRKIGAALTRSRT